MTLITESQPFNPAVFDERLRALTDPSFGVVAAVGATGIFQLVERPAGTEGHSPLVVITGPSGSGKDSVVETLTTQPGYSRVRTAVTRPRRDHEAPDAMVWMRAQAPGETPSEHLASLIAQHGLIEYDRHNEHVYGLPRQSLSEIVPGTVPILNTDTRGIATLREKLRDTHRIIGIMLCPESVDTLVNRISARGTNVAARLEAAQAYLGEAPGVIDYFVVSPHQRNARKAILEAARKVEHILGIEGVLPQLINRR